MGPFVWRRDNWIRIFPGFTILALIGLPFIAVGGLGFAGVIHQVFVALLDNTYQTTPSLVGSHLVGLIGCVIFFCVGLFAVFGGRYTTIDCAEGVVRVRLFFGFFTFAKSHELIGARRVTQRCFSDYEVLKHRRSLDIRGRGYSKSYLVELELQHGKRVLLATLGKRERAVEVVAQIAELLNVPSSDLGLLGSPYHQTRSIFR